MTTPSFLKKGGSLARPSGVVSGRMCSSAAHGSAWRVFRSLTGPARPRRRSAPASHAALAAGLAPRGVAVHRLAVIPYCSARFSAVSAIESPQCASRSASQSVSSSGAAGPSRRPQRAPRTTCGAWLIDSVPPASTTSRLAQQDLLRALDDGLEARAAEPVHGERRASRSGGPARRPTWRAR